MALSADLISQFVKTTNDQDRSSKASTIKGTVVVNGNNTYVKMDGSDQLTPVFTTTEMKDGDRVTVTIKDHIATATGNTTSPAARIDDVATMFHQATEGDIAATTAIIAELKAYTAEIKNLSVSDLAALEASIDKLNAKYATIDNISAKDVEILTADIENLRAQYISAGVTETETLKAVDAWIEQLYAKNAEFDNVSVKNLKAVRADVEELNAKMVSAEHAEFVFANIDFANIDKAVMKEFLANSGIIENATLNNGTVTGMLVGVTIKGDLIEGGTIVADKLVMRGDDGLYYKLNTHGVNANSKELTYKTTEETIDPVEGTPIQGSLTTSGTPVYCYGTGEDKRYYTIVDGVYYGVDAEVSNVELVQTDYNSLNGSIITAKSITATQIRVEDLVAFDATIGGFKITDNSIHSYIKDSEGNTTRGVYFDSDGQVNIGDANNYIKYIRHVEYVMTDTVVENVTGELIPDVVTEDNKPVYSYADPNGVTAYYTSVDDVQYEVYENVTYRLAISAESIEFALSNGSKQSLADIGSLGEYVRIGKYDNDGNLEPCIELGEADSDFKLVITNTRILFMEGTSKPAYITNQALHIDKAIVEDELQFGQFVWKKRENGNMGIVWVEEVTE